MSPRCQRAGYYGVQPVGAVTRSAAHLSCGGRSAEPVRLTATRLGSVIGSVQA